MPDQDDLPAGAMPYKVFTVHHPDYMKDYWCRTRAFYRGGPALLEDPVVMAKVFPRHNGETDRVFNIRKGLAHYVNYAGEIIDHMVAKLTSDPARPQADTDLDDFYEEFFENTAPSPARPVSLGMLVRKAFIEAQQTRHTWILADMNPADRTGEPASLAEQEQAGDLDVWTTLIPAESVIDWEEDNNGTLLWALVAYVSRNRPGLQAGRSRVKEEYFFYTPEGWTKWVVEYDEDKPPQPNDVIPLNSVGTHSFGRVPLVKLELPDGLWAGAKLESLAREHFNKRNALAWAEYKSLLPVLYEFIAPPDVLLSGPAADDNRAVNQTRSVAHVQERSSGDRVEWISPSPGPFQHTLDSVNSTKDEMHRIIHTMALSADNRNNSIAKSAESKDMDENAMDTILETLGEIGRDKVKELLSLVAAGRGDKIVWTVTGMTNFAAVETSHVLNQEAVLDTTIQIPSGTFKALRKFDLAERLLGDGASDEQLATIKEEIEQFYAQDSEMVEAQISREIATATLEMQAEESDEETQTPEVKPGGGVSFSSPGMRNK